MNFNTSVKLGEVDELLEKVNFVHVEKNLVVFIIYCYTSRDDHLFQASPQRRATQKQQPAIFHFCIGKKHTTIVLTKTRPHLGVLRLRIMTSMESGATAKVHVIPYKFLQFGRFVREPIVKIAIKLSNLGFY